MAGRPRAHARCSAVLPPHIQLLTGLNRPPAIWPARLAPSWISAPTCRVPGHPFHPAGHQSSAATLPGYAGYQGHAQSRWVET